MNTDNNFPIPGLHRVPHTNELRALFHDVDGSYNIHVTDTPVIEDAAPVFECSLRRQGSSTPVAVDPGNLEHSVVTEGAYDKHFLRYDGTGMDGDGVFYFSTIVTLNGTKKAYKAVLNGTCFPTPRQVD